MLVPNDQEDILGLKDRLGRRRIKGLIASAEGHDGDAEFFSDGASLKGQTNQRRIGSRRASHSRSLTSYRPSNSSLRTPGDGLFGPRLAPRHQATAQERNVKDAGDRDQTAGSGK